jgi:hypothetical protein
MDLNYHHDQLYASNLSSARLSNMKFCLFVQENIQLQDVEDSLHSSYDSHQLMPQCTADTQHTKKQCWFTC